MSNPEAKAGQDTGQRQWSANDPLITQKSREAKFKRANAKLENAKMKT